MLDQLATSQTGKVRPHILIHVVSLMLDPPTGFLQPDVSFSPDRHLDDPHSLLSELLLETRSYISMAPDISNWLSKSTIGTNATCIINIQGDLALETRMIRSNHRRHYKRRATELLRPN